MPAVRFLFIIAVLTCILIEIPIALLPPTARDALIYHLAYPKLYLLQGFIDIPFAFYSYYPMNTELLYMLPLYFGKDNLPAMIHTAFGIMTAALVYYYLKSETGKTNGLLGALIFLSTPIVIKLSTIPYVDLALGFHSTAAILTLLRWRIDKKTGWLVISGIFAGLAAGTKYNGLYIPLLLSIMTLHISKNDRPLKAFLVFSLISIVVASPWYIKNFIYTGNPFAPLFFNIFGGLEIPEQPTIPVFLKRHLFYGENWVDILLIPLKVFFQGKDDDMQYFDGVLNPVLLIFLPFAFTAKNQELRYMGLFSFFYFLLVFFTADMQIRFLLPILPLMSILAVMGIKQFVNFRGARVAVITATALLLFLNLTYLIGYFEKKEPLTYLMGKVTRDEYLAKHLRGYAFYRYINNNLPADTKILMIYTGDRGYYIERAYYYNSYLSGQPIREALKGSEDARYVAEKIRKMGITHILMDERLFEEFIETNLTSEQKELFYKFSIEHLKKLHLSEGYILYQLI